MYVRTLMVYAGGFGSGMVQSLIATCQLESKLTQGNK